MPASRHYGSSSSGSSSVLSEPSGFSNPWGSFGAGAPQLLSSGTPSSGGGAAPDSNPGVFGIDVTTPQGFVQSLQGNVQSAGDLFAGVGAALFGKDNGSMLGGVPVLGDLGRWAGEVAAPVTHPIGDIGGNAVNMVGGALEHVAFGISDQLKAEYDALPPEAKAEAEKAMAADNGIMGTGALSADGHYMFKAVQDYRVEQAKVNPVINPNLNKDAGPTMADAMTNLFTAIGAPVTAISRAVAEIPKIQSGMTRLEEIAAIAAGGTNVGIKIGPWETGIGAGSKGLNDVEATALANFVSGKWTSDQANDYLVQGGKAFSHADELNVAGSVAFDPTVWGSLGSAALAKLGATGLRLAELSQTAGRVAAEGGVVEETLAKGGQMLLRKPGSSGVLNPLGRLAENPDVLRAVQRYGEVVYSPLQGTSLGKVAKITRYIIDPLHAIGTGPNGNKLLDVASSETSAAVHAAYGWRNTGRVLEALHADGLFDTFAGNIATYSGNVLRSIVAEKYRASVILNGLAESLVGVVPGTVMDDLMKAVPKSYLDIVKQVATSVRVSIWDDAAKANLAERMASVYGKRDAAGWLEWFKANKFNDDMLGFLHAGSYGKATEDFLSAAGKAVQMEYKGKVPLQRVILLNKDTLTMQGARGLVNDLLKAAHAKPGRLARLGHADTMAYQKALIKEAQKLYPQLRYVQIHDENLASTISRFIEHLNDLVDGGALPTQIVDAEIAALPAPLQEFIGKVRGAWTLGFRPEDDLLWGMRLDGDKWVPQFSAWIDHVAQAVPAFRPIATPLLNVAGQAIPGASKAARMIDIMEAGARTLASRTTAATITEAARNRFIKYAVEGKDSRLQALGISGGLTTDEAEKIFRAILEEAQVHKTTARGLRETDMWKATEHLLPPRLRDSYMFTARDLRNLVITAYDGDLRFVGLTQKLTGRAKIVLAPLGGNVVGMISERVFPMIKYQINGIFQMQERIEPIILNSGRGVAFVWGSKMAENDRVAALLFERMVETGIARISDVDMVELSAMAMLGKAAENAVRSSLDPSMLEQLVNVQGSKRVNMLRTWQHQLGADLKPIFEQYQPGLWGRISDRYMAAAGYALTDDEVALRYLAEQMLGNDVEIIDGAMKTQRVMDFDAAINTAEWHAPATLGQLRPLELDFMAKRLALPLANGKTANSIGDIRAALADKDSGLTWERINDALMQHGASPDYIRRVKSALDFHWDNFWRDVRKSYGLDRHQVSQLQNMMVAAAKNRKMTPVEFMSQVYAPGVLAGEGAMIKSLEGAVSALRTPGADAILKGAEGPDFASLIDQLGSIFAHHLDPSMQRTLIEEFTSNIDGEIARLGASLDPEEQARAAELIKVRARMTVGNDLPAPTPPGPALGPDMVRADISHLTADEQAMLSPDFKPDEHISGVTQEIKATVDRMDPARVERELKAAGLPDAYTTYYDRLEEAQRADPLLQKVDSMPTNDLIAEGMYLDSVGLNAEDLRDGLEYADLRRQKRAAAESNVSKRGTKWVADKYDESAKTYRTKAEAIDAAKKAAQDEFEAANPEAMSLIASIDDNEGALRRGVSEHRADEIRKQIDRETELANREALTKHLADSTAASFNERYTSLVDQYGKHPGLVPAEYAPLPIEPARPLTPSYHPPADDPGYVYHVTDNFTAVRDTGLEPHTPDYRIDRAPAPEYAPDPLPSQDFLDRTPIVTRYDSGRADLSYGTDPVTGVRVRYSIEDRTAENIGWGYSWIDETGAGHSEFQFRTQADAMAAARQRHFDTITERLKQEEAAQAAAPSAMPADMWSDGTDGARSYFSTSSRNTEPYISDVTGDQALLRVKQDSRFTPERGTGEIVTTDTIRPEQMEYLGADNQWHPLAEPRPAAVAAVADPVAAPPVWTEEHAKAFTEEVLARIEEIRSGVKRAKKNRNPEVERAVRQFKVFAADVISDGLFSGEANPYTRLVEQMTGISRDGAAHYNASEHMMMTQVAEAMRAREQDAFMLQYFKRNRSFLERSVNHPIFGIYPASYMWGKIAPEMIRFIAKSPFGIKTGAMAKTMYDVQMSIATQREWDPAFDEHMTKIGANEMTWFLGFMVPAVPWDISAAAPAWVRDIAKQGLANQARVAAGKDPLPIDVGASVGKSLSLLDPRRSYDQARGAVGELANIVRGAVAPSKPQTATAQPQAPVINGPVSAAGLAPVLDDNVSALQRILAGQ